MEKIKSTNTTVYNLHLGSILKGCLKFQKTSSLEKVAYHEAGHAFAYISNFMSFKYVSIKREGNSYGHVKIRHRRGSADISYTPDNKLIKLIEIGYSGFISELLRTGGRNWNGAYSGFSKIDDLLTGTFPDPIEADLFLKWVSRRTTNLVILNWSMIDVIAKELLNHSILTREDVCKLFLNSHEQKIKTPALIKYDNPHLVEYLL